MTVAKKIATATDVAAGSNVVTAINDRLNRAETATLGYATYTLTGTTDTLTSEEFWDGGVIVLVGSPSGDHTLTVPASQERIVRVVNTTSVEVTIQISGQSVTAPRMPPKSADGSLAGIQGQEADIRSDGTNVRWAGIPIFAMTDAEYAALSAVDARALYTTI